MQALGIGLHPQFENTFMPARQGFMSSMFEGLGSGLSGMAGAGLGKFIQQGGKGGMFGNAGFRMGRNPTKGFYDEEPSAFADWLAMQKNKLNGGY